MIESLRGRIGRIQISSELFNEMLDGAVEPDSHRGQTVRALRQMFSKLFVARCEFRFDLHAFEYIAYSSSFDLIGEAHEAPLYMAVLNMNADVWFERVK